MSKFTHFDEQGAARMVDISEKQETIREAVAAGRIILRPETLRLILDQKVAKGDVFAVARVAGIMAAKKTSELIPLCHSLHLTSVEISFEPREEPVAVHIQATVKTRAQTGAEMEALTAVTAAGLTIYDMCKAVDREMTLSDIQLIRKSGGTSGVFEREKKA